MDLVPYVAQAQTYLATHPWACYAFGAATAAFTQNAPALTVKAFHWAMKFPIFRAWVLADPKKSKATVDMLASDLKAAIDEEAVTP